MTKKSISPQFSSFLDLCRWMAAFIVFAGHLRNEVFIGRPEMTGTNLFLNLWMLVSGMGHSAVMIFFVLSGFLVGGPLIKRIQDGKRIDGHYAGEYAIKRLVRLYLVVIPSLLLTVALALAVEHFCNPSYISNRPDQYTIQAFFGNLLFLQTIFVPTFGNNYPLWSLANEFWYYAFLPALYFAFRAPSIWVARGVLIFTGLCMSVILFRSNIMPLSMVWLMGALIFIYPRRIFPIIITLPAFILIMIYARLRFSGGYIPGDILLGAIFALLVNSVYQTELSWRWLSATQHFNKWAADFSFTTYAVHVPLLLALIEVLRTFDVFPESKHDPLDWRAWGSYFLIGGVTLALCYLVAQLTEARTENVKQWFLTRLNSQQVMTPTLER